MPLRKVIISGGGTGGHIFPAVAIANALKEKYPDIDILFVGAMGRMEMEKVPAAGYKIEGLNISGIQRKLTLKNLAVPFKIIGSTLKAKRILKAFKPDIVIGTGGYASGPMLRVAAKKGIPTVIQEQNSFPGLTNKILSKRVNKICVAFDGLEKFFPKEKIVLTGNPVRSEVVKLQGKKPRAAEFFVLNEQQPTILIVGGSLGARTINHAVKKFAAEWNSNYQVIWQTGKPFFEEAKKHVEENKLTNIKVYDFISKMDLAYAMADVVISRAGAIAISELCLVQKPVVLIPSPNVAEDHQTKNAMALVNHGAAVLVKDVDAVEKLGTTMDEIMNNKEKQEQLTINITKLGLSNATNAIVGVIEQLVK
ncbi:MAG TPA: undecaprenyldiphospho-muramoylpentapeptide beta-N-acetylglucosaminyltransferase [Flavobacteriales bacterium]|nr:undecaprenyldiphospho-muramoylpentapeptide beta-N-acetylglucosaminyltransferase [Flavobacteriales bacterium]